MIFNRELSYNIVTHCTLNCDGCGSKSELESTKSSFFDIDKFRSDVELASTFMRVEEFTISGGEPLLHKQLVDFIKIVKSSNITNCININTNGQLIKKQSSQFWDNVNKITLSLYPNTKIDNNDIKEFVKQKCQEYNILLEINSPSEFMVIWNNSLEKRDVQGIFNECKITHEWQCHSIHNGRYYKCPGPIIDNIETDGVILEETAVIDYLNNKTPLKCCYNCNGTSGPKIPHRQVINNYKE